MHEQLYAAQGLTDISLLRQAAEKSFNTSIDDGQVQRFLRVLEQAKKQEKNRKKVLSRIVNLMKIHNLSIKDIADFEKCENEPLKEKKTKSANIIWNGKLYMWLAMSNSPERQPPFITPLYERFKSGLPVNDFFATPENSISSSKLLARLERETGVKVSDVQLNALGIGRNLVDRAQLLKTGRIQPKKRSEL